MNQTDPQTSAIIAMADGRLDETRERLVGADRAGVARQVASEIVERTAYFDPPEESTAVELALTAAAGETHRFVLEVGPGGARLHPGRVDTPVRISQDLAEMLRAVFGTGYGRHDATREVWILDEPGPSSDEPDDAWHTLLRSTTAAAGQILSAISLANVDLGALARRCGSDKWGSHFYTPHYETHFEEYRDQRINLLEIGVGGYEEKDQGGESLAMWRAYFRRGLIYGLDVHNKSSLDRPRIVTIQGDQGNAEHLSSIAAAIGPLDIVIDDGSHFSDHVLTSFTVLFPLLADGGVYVVEDLHTSYWPEWNGNRCDRNDPATTTGFLKLLIDGLHHQDRLPDDPSPLPSEIERQVRAVHLYHNIAFVEKGLNADQGAPEWIRRGRPQARTHSDIDLHSSSRTP